MNCYQIVRYKLKENCNLLTHKCGNFDSSNTSKKKKQVKKGTKDSELPFTFHNNKCVRIDKNIISSKYRVN